MFRRLSRLLFGGEEVVSEDVKSGDVVEDGWLVVPHQGMVFIRIFTDVTYFKKNFQNTLTCSEYYSQKIFWCLNLTVCKSAE